MERSDPLCCCCSVCNISGRTRRDTARHLCSAAQYPAGAKARHLSGSGVFALHIQSNGVVTQVETFKSIGHPQLDRAAIAAFREWRFHPSEAACVLRIPIRYVDGPKDINSSMLQTPAPGWGMSVTVFSGAKA